MAQERVCMKMYKYNISQLYNISEILKLQILEEMILKKEEDCFGFFLLSKFL